MRAVHFGAGNIGRGFIGSLLYQAGYHTTFVDVNANIIAELNRQKQYEVTLAAEKQETITVHNVAGINSSKQPQAVIDAIVQADIVTTAVGPDVLPAIADLLARGLSERMRINQNPLNVIACENMVGGSTRLQELVEARIPSNEQVALNDLVGFPDAAVDRIVPNQTNDDPLHVAVEPYYEWLVAKTDVKGVKPQIVGLTYVDDLTPYIERKLLTVNTGHAATAYIGFHKGYTTIYEAIKDEQVQRLVEGILQESGEALIHMYGFDPATQQRYIQQIIERFLNPYISDDICRVGRGPLRKLGPNDRLIRPASLYVEKTGQVPTYLTKAIAAALTYQNENDDEAAQLQRIIAEQGYQATLMAIADLKADSLLVPAVLAEVDELTK